MKLIIGIHGKLGSGKDWIASNIIVPILEKKKIKHMVMSLADQIKINIIVKEKISYKDVFEKKTQQTRILLQNEGTNCRKDNENIWIDYIINWINVYNDRGIEVFIIPDIRFKNEYNYLKKEGNAIIIKVIAQQRNNERLLEESKGNKNIYNKIKTHQSEIDMDDMDDIKDFDLVINNDIDLNVDITNLSNKLENLLFNNKFNKFI